jgi:hypothetical protein
MPTAACDQCGATVTVTDSLEIQVDYEAMGKLCKVVSSQPFTIGGLMGAGVTNCPHMNQAIPRAYPPRPPRPPP